MQLDDAEASRIAR